MSIQFKTLVSCTILFLLFASPCLSSETVTKKTENATTENDVTKQTASVYFPSPNYKFEKVVEGVELTHDFIIMNKGTEVLHVQKVKTG